MSSSGEPQPEAHQGRVGDGMVTFLGCSCTAGSGGAVNHWDRQLVAHGQVLQDPPWEMALICSSEDGEAGGKVVPPAVTPHCSHGPPSCTYSSPEFPNRQHRILTCGVYRMSSAAPSSSWAQGVPIHHLLLSPVCTALGGGKGGVFSPPGFLQGCCPVPAS